MSKPGQASEDVHQDDLSAQKKHGIAAEVKQNGNLTVDTNHTSVNRVEKSKRSFVAYGKMKRLFNSKSKETDTTTPRLHSGQTTSSMPSENGVNLDVVSSSPPASPGIAVEESDTDFCIPADGNMSTFSPEQLIQFFKYLNLTDRTISKLRHRKMDGRRFSQMTDADLDRYGINTPIIVYFRDRSERKRTGGTRRGFIL